MAAGIRGCAAHLRPRHRGDDTPGFDAPILVGGAAAELHSGSAISTGDFDVVTGRQQAFEDALVALGFIRPVAPGDSFTGMLHPELALGFEVVVAVLLDGAAERERVRVFTLGEDGSVTAIAPEMLEQARHLFALSDRLDLVYPDRRIREETGGHHDLATFDTP